MFMPLTLQQSAFAWVFSVGSSSASVEEASRCTLYYDIETQTPAFFHITAASVHDSKAMGKILYETGAYCIFDRGYNHFKSLSWIETIGSYFVLEQR